MTFKLTAGLDDATCSVVAGTPQLKNAKITVRWQGTNPAGRLQTVATSKARIASAFYDSGTDVFTLVTEPIYNGAFAGQTATLRLGFDSYVDAFEGGCTPEGGFLAMSYGETNPSSREVTAEHGGTRGPRRARGVVSQRSAVVRSTMLVTFVRTRGSHDHCGPYRLDTLSLPQASRLWRTAVQICV